MNLTCAASAIAESTQMIPERNIFMLPHDDRSPFLTQNTAPRKVDECSLTPVVKKISIRLNALASCSRAPA